MNKTSLRIETKQACYKIDCLPPRARRRARTKHARVITPRKLSQGFEGHTLLCVDDAGRRAYAAYMSKHRQQNPLEDEPSALTRPVQMEPSQIVSVGHSGRAAMVKSMDATDKAHKFFPG